MCSLTKISVEFGKTRTCSRVTDLDYFFSCSREHYPFVWTSLEPYYNTYVARFLIDAVSIQMSTGRLPVSLAGKLALGYIVSRCFQMTTVRTYYVKN